MTNRYREAIQNYIAALQDAQGKDTPTLDAARRQFVKLCDRDCGREGGPFWDSDFEDEYEQVMNKQLQLMSWQDVRVYLVYLINHDRSVALLYDAERSGLMLKLLERYAELLSKEMSDWWFQ